MAHDDDHDHPTPEQEIATARQAFASGDLKHALHHVGCALTSNPMHQEYMGLLNQIVGTICARPDAMQLTELEEGPNFVDAAMRSYVLAWMRNWEEALDLITDVAVVRPDIPWLLWAEWWLSQPGVVASITWDEFASGTLVDLAKITQRCPTPMEKDDPRLTNVQAAARIIDSIRGVYGNQGFVWFTAVMIGRRLGSTEQTLEMAQHAFKLDGKSMSAVSVANVLRDLKRTDEAAKWFHKAADIDKEDVSAFLDCGDMYIDAQRWDDAIAEYDKVLKRSPDHTWATPSRYYCYFKKSGDIKAKLALLRETERGDDTQRARELAQSIDPPFPFLTFIPRPGDASANGLNAIFEEMFDNPAKHHGSTVRLKLSHLESPSVVAAFWLQMEMWGPTVGFDYQVEKIQTPDPRLPKAQVPFAIWQWDGTQPRPLLARPDYQFLRKIHEIAAEPFHFDIWGPAAQKLARELGPGATQHLLAAMTFPPRPPGSNWRVINWTHRAQIAIALVLAHVDEGWQGSMRQRALYSLLYGPTDWTTGAAIVALGYLGRKEPAIRAEVLQAFAWLQGQIPAEGFCCWEYPLVCTWMAFDGLDEVTKKRLATWQDKVENEEGKSTVRMCELEAKKFDQAAEMQKAQAAQQQVAAGGGGDPDPVVFPGQRVAKLSDYVTMMKRMQTGDMMGAIGAYGLDMMSYGQVAMAWGQKLAADPTLNAKFAAMMTR
ncbi:MAG: tetratricopeptide repeat protein [Deltaproteobacteria bacterium]|nr:tetratricopeptide repeat protein [Deltaproteobacteria bacterium]